MKQLLILLTILSTSVYSFAQQGTLTGKVTDKTTGEALLGAVVYIKGSSKGAATDMDGTFELKLDPGSYKISVSSLSYKATEYDNIRIEPNKTTKLNLAIEQDQNTLDVVTIVGEKNTNTEMALINDLKQSEVVANGVSGEQMAKTMDRDAADVVKRIPGVTVMNDKYISIRGLSERYNTVMLNDVLTPSTEIDSRAFSFDIIPTSVIDRILIYKSGSPELPGEFGGGVIKIYTKNFADENATSVSTSLGYRTNTTFQDFSMYDGGKTDFLGFDDGTRSLPGQFPTNLNQLEQNPEARAALGKELPNNWRVSQHSASPDARFSLGLTRRLNAGDLKISNISAISYSNTRKFKEVTRFRYEDFDTEKQQSPTEFAYTDQQSNQNIRVGVLHNWSVRINQNDKIEFRNLFNQLGNSQVTVRNGENFANGVEIANTAMRYESRTIYSGQLQGTHNRNEDKTQFNWTGGYSYTNRNEPDYRRYRTQRNAGTDDPFKVVIPYGPNTFDAGRFYSKLNEHVVMGSADIEHKFLKSETDENPIKVSAGLYTEYKKRDFDARWFSYTRSSNFPEALLTKPVEEIFAPENFSSNNGLTLEEGTNPSDSYQATNLLTAAYTKVSVPVIADKLSASGGVRVEHNKRQLTTGTFGGMDIEKEYPLLNILPSLNVTYNFNLRSLLRFGYSMSVNRPEFREQAPFTYYDFNYDVEIKGDTELKTATIQNTDVRYEFYPNPTELISAGIFYKNFKNPIEFVQGFTSGNPRFTYQNAESAYSVGVETEVRKSLADLSESTFIQDLTVVVNAALIKSQVNLGESAYAQGQLKERQLMGQSPYIVNTGLYYQNNAKGLQVNVLYNIIGKRIFLVGNSLNPTIYEMPRNVLDFAITKKIGNQFEVKAGVQDLLNQSSRLVQDSNTDANITSVDERIETYRPGTYTTVGVTYRF